MLKKKVVMDGTFLKATWKNRWEWRQNKVCHELLIVELADESVGINYTTLTTPVYVCNFQK